MAAKKTPSKKQISKSETSGDKPKSKAMREYEEDVKAGKNPPKFFFDEIFKK